MIRSAPSCVGGQDAEESDGAVTDDGDGLAGAGLGGNGGEPAGAEDVGGGQQAGDQVVVGHARGGDQGAVGVRDAGSFGLGADGAVDELGVHAPGLVAGPADLAGVVGDDEGADDEVPGLHGLHVVADLLDDADVLVPHQQVVRRARRRGRATGRTRRCRSRSAG